MNTLTMSLITYEKLSERCAEGSFEYIALKNAVVDTAESGVVVTLICDDELTEALLKTAASCNPVLTDRITLSRDGAPAMASSSSTV